MWLLPDAQLRNEVSVMSEMPDLLPDMSRWNGETSSPAALASITIGSETTAPKRPPRMPLSAR